jgi:hypothetical protein
VEKTLYLHQARRLGFCKQALSRPKTILGTGDLAQVHTSRGTTSWNSEAIRMAYFPALFRVPDYYWVFRFCRFFRHVIRTESA